MKNKGIVLLALVVIGSWLVLKLHRDDVRYKLASNREQKISTIRKDIEKIQQPMGNHSDHSHDSVTLTSLYDVTQIIQLEGKIRDLQTQNDIELSKRFKSTFPEFLPILLLAIVLAQNGMLIKQVNELKKNRSDSN
jgi:hypothetical protein